MPPIRRTCVTMALVLAVATGLVACTAKKNETAALPPASDLLTASAAAMRDVKTTHFAIDVQGTVAGIALHRAEGTLTRAGEAKGTATVEQAGSPLEFEFVIVGTTLYIKGATGGFQQLPLAVASTTYDPSAILDPDRGVAKLLGASVAGARTEAREQAGGQDAYRVAVSAKRESLEGLIPGVGDGVTGKLWLAVDSKRLLKGVFTLPASGSDKGSTVTITFTDYDKPVTISAP
jgi:lipoprotein LprG